MAGAQLGAINQRDPVTSVYRVALSVTEPERLAEEDGDSRPGPRHKQAQRPISLARPTRPELLGIGHFAGCPNSSFPVLIELFFLSFWRLVALLVRQASLSASLRLNRIFTEPFYTFSYPPPTPRLEPRLPQSENRR